MYSSVFASIFSFLLQLTCVVFPPIIRFLPFSIAFLASILLNWDISDFPKKWRKKNTEISRDSSYTLKKVAFFTSEKSELLSLTPTPTERRIHHSSHFFWFTCVFSNCFLSPLPAPPVLFLIIFHLLSVLKFKPSILRMCYFLFCFLPEKRGQRGREEIVFDFEILMGGGWEGDIAERNEGFSITAQDPGNWDRVINFILNSSIKYRRLEFKRESNNNLKNFPHLFDVNALLSLSLPPPSLSLEVRK